MLANCVGPLPHTTFLPWGSNVARRFEADEILTVRQIVHPVLQAEWDLRYSSGHSTKCVHALETCVQSSNTKLECGC